MPAAREEAVRLCVADPVDPVEWVDRAAETERTEVVRPAAGKGAAIAMGVAFLC